MPYPSSDLSAPTDAEFIAYFGRSPRKNDVILAYISQNGVILDSKQYYYEPDIRHEVFYIGDPITRADADPMTHRHVFILPTSLWNNTVTWTYSIYDYQSNMSGYTTFQNLTTETTNNGGRFEMGFTFNQSDFSGATPWYEIGHVSVTATYPTGSVTWTTEQDNNGVMVRLIALE